MPQYIYKHPEEDIYVEVFQRMNDKHEYFDEGGVEWKRVFTIPQMGVDTKIDPSCPKSFLKKSEKMKTYGEAIDLSKEMSGLRGERAGGVDPMKAGAEKRFYGAN